MSSQPFGQSTDASPQLHGSGGGTFDRPAKRWLPVSPEQVSPDGASYAYFDFVGARPLLNVVDPRSGASRVVLDADPAAVWSLIGYLSDGIYLTHGNGMGQADTDPDRLWRVAQSGALIPISDHRSAAWRISGGYAWGIETDDASKIGQRGNENRLLRVDITTGAATVWFRRTGAGIVALGTMPNGGALVLVSDPLALWLVAAPGMELPVAPMGAYPNTISDSHGLWLANEEGIFLIRPDGSVIAVSGMRGLPVGACA